MEDNPNLNINIDDINNDINNDMNNDEDDGLIHITDDQEELIDSIFARETELEIDAAMRNRLRGGRNIGNNTRNPIINRTRPSLDLSFLENSNNNNLESDETRDIVSDEWRYQPNINNRYNMAGDTIELQVTCYSLVFYYDFNEISFLENSNKIVLPKRVLFEISNYENIKYPLHFTLGDSDILLSVYEFKENIDEAFIPKYLFHKCGISECQTVKLTLINKEIEKGEYVKIQPHTSNFLEIENPKEFLETNLVKLYSCIKQGSQISLPYFDTNIYFDIIKCKPCETISIIDTDVEVDFDKPLDYVEPPKPENKTSNNLDLNNESFQLGNLNFQAGNQTQFNHKPTYGNVDASNQPHQHNQNKGFVAFSGKGYSLKD